MSYTKQTWVTGDTITAEKLNHIEDGIGSGGSLIVEMTLEGEESHILESNILTTDMASAFTNGIIVILHIPEVAQFSVQESYAMLLGYIPESTGIYSYQEKFYFDYESTNMISQFYTDNEGYFCAEIYID